jgi:hypothetical protein
MVGAHRWQRRRTTASGGAMGELAGESRTRAMGLGFDEVFSYGIAAAWGTHWMGLRARRAQGGGARWQGGDVGLWRWHELVLMVLRLRL